MAQTKVQNLEIRIAQLEWALGWLLFQGYGIGGANQLSARCWQAGLLMDQHVQRQTAAATGTPTPENN